MVNVFEPTYAEIGPEWYDELVDKRHAEIDAILSEFETPGPRRRHRGSRPGHEPIEVVADYVDEVGASLAVIGAHGTHRAGGLGGGRPAHALLHHTNVPLATIHDSFRPLAGGIVTVGVDGSGANAGAVEWAEQLAADAGATIHAVFAYDPLGRHVQPPRGMASRLRRRTTRSSAR